MTKRIVVLISKETKENTELSNLIMSKHYNSLLVDLFNDIEWLQAVLNRDEFTELYTYKPNYDWQTEVTINVSDVVYNKLKALSKKVKEPMKEVAGKLIDIEMRYYLMESPVYKGGM